MTTVLAITVAFALWRARRRPAKAAPVLSLIGWGLAGIARSVLRSTPLRLAQLGRDHEIGGQIPCHPLVMVVDMWVELLRHVD